MVPVHQIFSQVQVSVTPANNSRLITWLLHPHFVPTGTSLSFYVEVGQSAGTWTRLNPTTPIINNNVYIDNGPYLQDARTLTYYRVVLATTAGSVTTEYASVPTGVHGPLEHRERQIVREVLRRNYLNMARNNGNYGYLVRKREWGTPCACADPDLGMPASHSCPLCQGTGVEQGYYPACPFWLEFTQVGPVARTDTGQVGVQLQQQVQAVAVNYPTPAQNDLWVDSATGDRYIIESVIEHLVMVRNMPILLGLALRKLPVTDPAFAIEVDTETAPMWTNGIATF